MATNRGSINRDETLRLWVLAGGRCEYCNAYLLEDEFSGYTLNLSERAHIVGATQAAGSPRGEADLPLSERELAANLMLLCRAHHRLIDRLIAEHTVEGLRLMKREHEDRIRLLTGFTNDVETVVVRVVGGIRGAPVEIPADTVLTAVRGDGRFPRYRLALAGEDVEIDLRRLPDEGDASYWTAGARIIEDRVSRIKEAQQSIGHISVFALARIPLLVALGFHLDDKIPTTVYQRRRDGSGDQGWGFDPDAEPVTFQTERISSCTDTPGRVALAVSLTAPIGADVISAASNASVYEITPVATAPSRDVMTARASLDAFAATYHRFLGIIERDHPDCTQIEIFPAAPASAAVQLGRGIMRDAQPDLVVYDRQTDGTFQPALTLTR
jgi:hypothetical protein